MFYALGTSDYLMDKLESVVFVGPCLYGNFGSSYEQLVYQFKGLKDLGVYSLGGDNWNEEKEKICDNMDEYTCNFYKYLPDSISPGPIGTLQHLYQNGVEDKFMERIPIEQYAAGQRSAPMVEYEDLDGRFQIRFVVGELDDGCNMAQTERIARDMDNASYTFDTEWGMDHNHLALTTDPQYVDRLVRHIEMGAEYARMKHQDGGLDDAWETMFGMDGASTLVTGSALALSALALSSF